MHESNAIPQGSVSHGQILAAIGILFVLGVTIPLLGIIMIPVVALATVAQAFSDAVVESGLLKKVRAPHASGQGDRVATGSTLA
jgi:hypothetical protein